VRVSPLLVLVSVLVGASIGGWLGGIPGGIVGALLAVPTAAAIQTVIRDVWRETAPNSPSPSGNGNLPVCSCPGRSVSLQPRLHGAQFERHHDLEDAAEQREQASPDDQEERLRADGRLAICAGPDSTQEPLLTLISSSKISGGSDAGLLTLPSAIPLGATKPSWCSRQADRIRRVQHHLSVTRCAEPSAAALV
jgi:hypothetical protein